MGRHLRRLINFNLQLLRQVLNLLLNFPVLLDTYKFKGNTKLFLAEILMLHKLTLLCELHILSI
jgi:hypothetical protein